MVISFLCYSFCGSFLLRRVSVVFIVPFMIGLLDVNVGKRKWLLNIAYIFIGHKVHSII